MGRARKMNPTEPGIQTWQVQRSSGVFSQPHMSPVGLANTRILINRLFSQISPITATYKPVEFMR